MSVEVLSTLVVTGAMGLVEFAANWLVQSTLLLAAGLLVGIALRRYGSAVQSAAYRTTLLTVLVAPLATALLGGAGYAGWAIHLTEDQAHAAATPPVPIRPAQEASRSVSAVAFRSSTDEQAVDRSPVAPRAESASRADAPSPLAPPASVSPNEGRTWEGIAFRVNGGLSLLSLLWIAVSMVLLIGYVQAVKRVRRLRRSATVTDAGSVELLRELAGWFGVRPPQLLWSPLIPSACLSGIRRPAILLPDEPMPLPLREVLSHELAHLRRRDCLWSFMSQIATAVFFFQPLLWVLSRRIEAAAEEVCDDYVVELGADPKTYASRLLDVAEHSLAPMNAAGVGIIRIRSLLDRRIRRILNTTRKRSITSGRTLTFGVLGGGIAATIAAGLVGAVNPENEYGKDDTTMTQNEIQSKTLRGVVRNTEGAPLADAPVYLIAHVERWEPINRMPSRPEVASSVRTDDQGRFELKVEAERAGLKGYQIVAVPADHAITPGPWLVDLAEAGEQIHEMVVSESVLIEGTILSPDGEPVSGAEIRLARISSRHSSDEWRGIDVLLFGTHWLDPFFDFWPVPVETDAEGRFRLQATGPESIARLRIAADGFAPAKIEVATADLAAVLAEGRQGRKESREEFVKPRFTHALELPRIFEGTIADEQSGEPLAGVEVLLTSADHGPIDWRLTATTDANGNYRIKAAPAKWVYMISANAEGHIGYSETFSGDTVEQAVTEKGVMRHNIRLTPAVRLQGRVLDEGTDSGLANVAVLYHPGEANPFKQGNHSFAEQVARTDREGNFLIRGLPGKGYLLAEINSEEYVRTAFPMYRGDIRPHGDTYPNGFSEIDAPNEESWETPPILLREGVELDVELTGPNGEAVEKFHVATLESSGNMSHVNLVSDRSPHRGGRYRMVGISQDHTYRTYFYSPDLNAGAVIDLHYDPAMSEVREVRLQPSATVRGRLLYEDGTPAKDVVVFPKFLITDDDPEEVDFWSSKVASLGNVTRPKPPNLRTDANGGFERTGFFPGAYASLTLNQPFADGERHHRIGVLEAGEVRNLGNLELKQ